MNHIDVDVAKGQHYKALFRHYRRWNWFLVFTNMATLVLVAILAIEVNK